MRQVRAGRTDRPTAQLIGMGWLAGAVSWVVGTLLSMAIGDLPFARAGELSLVLGLVNTVLVAGTLRLVTRGSQPDRR